jgi:hypothetical protein
MTTLKAASIRGRVGGTSPVRVIVDKSRFVAVSMVVFTMSANAMAAGVALIDINSAGGTVVGADTNGNFWTNLTAISTATPLVNTANAAFGGSLTLTDTAGADNGFTGGAIEGGPAPGEFNILNAYRDAWFDNSVGGSVATFTFSGLDPSAMYTLTLWGNRDSSGAIGTVNVTSGSVGGGNRFSLALDSITSFAAKPSAGGNLAFSFDDTSADVNSAVLNVMRLEQLAPLAAPPAVRTISVNFGIALNDANAVNVDETAVGGNPAAQNVSGVYWNNVFLQGTGSPGIPTAFTANTQGGNSLQLIDNSGTAAAQLTSNGSFFAGFANTSAPNQDLTGDAGLFQSYLNIGGSGAPGESITVSNLSGEFTTGGYNVVVFFDLEQARTYGLTVTDGLRSETFWVSDLAASDADANNDGNIEWVRALGTTDLLATVGANYAVFSGFRGSSFTITGLGSNGRAVISGFQVIAVPEPSSIVAWIILSICSIVWSVRQCGVNKTW